MEFTINLAVSLVLLLLIKVEMEVKHDQTPFIFDREEIFFFCSQNMKRNKKKIQLMWYMRLLFTDVELHKNDL